MNSKILLFTFTNYFQKKRLFRKTLYRMNMAASPVFESGFETYFKSGLLNFENRIETGC